MDKRFEAMALMREDRLHASTSVLKGRSDRGPLPPERFDIGDLRLGAQALERGAQPIAHDLFQAGARPTKERLGLGAAGQTQCGV
jgi:hypothetical protein